MKELSPKDFINYNLPLFTKGYMVGQFTLDDGMVVYENPESVTYPLREVKPVKPSVKRQIWAKK